jgi:hypothetical protein
MSAFLYRKLGTIHSQDPLMQDLLCPVLPAPGWVIDIRKILFNLRLHVPADGSDLPAASTPQVADPSKIRLGGGFQLLVAEKIKYCRTRSAHSA